MGKQMVTLLDSDTFFIGGRKIRVRKKIRQYYECQHVFVVRLDESDGNPEKQPTLIGIGYAEDDFKNIWEFPYDDVVGISLEIPELKKPEEFISVQHYQKYIEDYAGKELLIVYAGNFRYRVDANTGKIYSKMESR